MNGPEGVERLDWALFDDPARIAAVAAIDEHRARASMVLQAVTRLAATTAGSAFAQISLIGTSQFVPAAYGISCGPEHTPTEESLCSVTMASRGALAIADTKSETLVSQLPPVTSGAVGSYLGTPLISAQGLVLGALCVYDERPRVWTKSIGAALEDCADIVTEQLELLSDIDSAASDAVRLRAAIAEILEVGETASARGVKSAIRYRMRAHAPAGGDWADLIALGADRLGISIGDVSGNGLAAVATMDAVRHSLRAHVFQCGDPAQALIRSDHLLAVTKPGVFVTGLQAVLNVENGLLRFASAGHPPPLLLRNGKARLLSVSPGPPLGFGGNENLGIAELTLREGDRLVLVTDGVFERRNEVLDTGLDRLANVAEGSGRLKIDDFADAVIAKMVDEQPTDDACLFVLEL